MNFNLKDTQDIKVNLSFVNLKQIKKFFSQTQPPITPQKFQNKLTSYKSVDGEVLVKR